MSLGIMENYPNMEQNSLEVPESSQVYDIFSYIMSKNDTTHVKNFYEEENTSCSSVSMKGGLERIVEEHPECLSTSIFDETRDDALADLLVEQMSEEVHHIQPERATKCSINYDNIEKELIAQNEIATQLLQKYFPKDDNDVRNDEKCRSNIQSTLSQALIMLEKKTSDKQLQVCLKPSDMYVIFDVNHEFPVEDPPIKFLRPYRYHRPYTGSSALVHPYINRPVKALINFYMNEKLNKGPALVVNAQADNSLDTIKSDYREYLNLKNPLDDSMNQILYKNDREFLRTDISSEDIREEEVRNDLNPYFSLRNLYSHSYLEDYWSKSHLHTFPDSFERKYIPFADSISEFREADKQYEKWLKRHRTNKHTDLTIPSVATIATDTPPDSLSYASEKRPKWKKLKRARIEKLKCRLEFLENLGLINVLQYFFLYEHVVLINFIDTVFTYRSLEKKADMSVTDRLAQLFLLVVSYYIIRFLSGLEISKELSICI